MPLNIGFQLFAHVPVPPTPKDAHASLAREVDDLQQQLAEARKSAAAAGAARDAMYERLQAAERAKQEAQEQLDVAAAGAWGACGRWACGLVMKCYCMPRADDWNLPRCTLVVMFSGLARSCKAIIVVSLYDASKTIRLRRHCCHHDCATCRAEVSEMREQLRLMAERLAARDQAVAEHIQVCGRCGWLAMEGWEAWRDALTA